MAGISDELHVGLVGETGSGKTSFIEAMMKNNSTEPAETSAKAKTSEPKCVLHPSNQNIKLWDLPGLGTALYPDSESYYERLELEKKYNAFLLFTSKTQLTTNTQSLIIRLEAAWKPFILIRSFIDLDVDGGKRSGQQNFNEGEMLEEIRQKLREVSQHLDSPGGEHIFLISNVKPEEWDFDRLMNTVSDELRTYQPSIRQKDDLAFRLAKLNLVEKERNINAGEEAWIRYFQKGEDIASKIQEKGIEGVQEDIEREFDSWKNIKIRMAIIGEAGCGKSSFTNAIRGFEDVDDDDDREDIAKTGTTETTKVHKEYKYPDNPNVTLVDCPGIGTENFRDLETYSSKIDIETYDVFVIMTATRFKADTGDLARKVRLLNKPFFFVRTKVDDDERNQRRKKAFNEVEFLEKIKEDCSIKLKSKDATLGNNDIFLISNYYPRHWDFSRLIKAINSRLPFQKRECFLFSTIVLSKDILREKVEALKGGIWYVSFRSIVWKAVTFTEYSRRTDFHSIVEYVKFYRSQLGFPNEESDEFKKMSPERQEALREFFLDSTKDVESWLKKFDRDDNTESRKFPPWLNADKAQEAPYRFVSCALHQVLDEMQKLAIEIIHDATAREQAKLDMNTRKPRQESQQ